jgi:hypothetical protein
LNKALVLIPVLLLAAGFVVFCEVDLARAEEVRYLPKWVWAILCMGVGLTIPFGGSLTWCSGRSAGHAGITIRETWVWPD